MAAYTPNTPWADMGCGSLVNPDGAGTSSATPQCASAATLWLQKHRPNPSEKWQIVEAVRHALFTSANKEQVAWASFFGNGLLRANDALGVPFNENLEKPPQIPFLSLGYVSLAHWSRSMITIPFGKRCLRPRLCSFICRRRVYSKLQVVLIPMRMSLRGRHGKQL